MRILVTGGAGFIGSHVCHALLQEGHRVSVLDDLSTGRLENVPPGVAFHHLSVTGELDTVFETERPGAVVHLAAQVSVPRSLQEPGRDLAVNAGGTLNILEHGRRFGVERFILASSAAVYGEPRYLPLDEEHPVSPCSPYALSKYTAEQYMALYRNLYGLSCCVLRYANVFGPRQAVHAEGGVVAIFCERLAGGRVPVIFGDGEQTRDFVYVEDVVRANCAALTAGEGVFNIGTGQATTVNRLWRCLKELTGSRMEPDYRPSRPGDIRDSLFNPARAAQVLGWQPSYGLESGLAAMTGEL
ncbi:MAG TPA: SDR family oxidoreductase [Spirochaetia bacterium]|nr:SDR family oxidoreductase [Spirochaetia bacterium]